MQLGSWWQTPNGVGRQPQAVVGCMWVWVCGDPTLCLLLHAVSVYEAFSILSLDPWEYRVPSCHWGLLPSSVVVFCIVRLWRTEARVAALRESLQHQDSHGLAAALLLARVWILPAWKSSCWCCSYNVSISSWVWKPTFNSIEHGYTADGGSITKPREENMRSSSVRSEPDSSWWRWYSAW